jgi:hypothetical protein
MRRIFKIFWFLSACLFFLNSCSDDDDITVKYLKKIIETSEGGIPNTTFLTYDGNKIVSIENDQIRKDFTYAGNLITKVVSQEKLTKLKNTFLYFYDSGRLVKVESVNAYRIDYAYNSDGTVFFEKTDISKGILEVKLYSGKLYFQNENIVKIERVSEDTLLDMVTTYRESYAYDVKKNPFYNILGYKKLLDQNELISLNNNLITTIETSIEIGNQHVSSASLYKHVFKYDSSNYPIEKLSEVPLPNKKTTVFYKSEYFY